ncbi:MAG: DUF5615 family PIN-like protein [Deltaproteobacteria bacterium]|nr:DUF5615 family PIN-like protein [Deltaproteobacteria bacterium]
MKFVADEDLDRQVVELLCRERHVVWYVAGMAPGASDHDMLNLANHEKAMLLTADKDFGELVFCQHLLDPSVILLRSCCPRNSRIVRLTSCRPGMCMRRPHRGAGGLSREVATYPD